MHPIPENRERFLKDLYLKYRTDFLAWSFHEFKGSKAESADLFQDAVIIFYRKVVSGQLGQLEVSVKTYLFGIGKKLWLKKKHQEINRRKLRFENKEKINHLFNASPSHLNEKNAQIDLLDSTIKKLGSNCQKIITLFYFYKYSIESIKEELNLASAVSVRNRKRQCMLQLKKFMMEVKSA